MSHLKSVEIELKQHLHLDILFYSISVQLTWIKWYLAISIMLFFNRKITLPRKITRAGLKELVKLFSYSFLCFKKQIIKIFWIYQDVSFLRSCCYIVDQDLSTTLLIIPFKWLLCALTKWKKEDNVFYKKRGRESLIWWVKSIIKCLWTVLRFNLPRYFSFTIYFHSWNNPVR